MGKEDQQEEREVLESIFPDEIQDISDTSFRVTIKLDLPESKGDDEEEEQPTIILKVTYPADYPEVAPDLEISAPHNAPKFELLDVQEDKDRLLEGLQPTIEENLGMAMVFTLVTSLKENAEQLMSERASVERLQQEAEAAKAEEEENKKFQGTQVTKETFLEWFHKFQAELAEELRRKQEEREAEEKKKRVIKDEKKLTGRELWERGIAKGDQEEDEGEDLAKGVSEVRVNS